MQAHMFAPGLTCESTQPPLIGGRYLVREVLGQGGMGAVLRVHDRSAGKQFALKRLRAGEKTTHVALFEREYHTLAGLRHPHIVEVYDYGHDAEGPYYTMELLDGGEIHSKAPLPWTDVCRVLRDVCSGLSLIHARGLVHRDVSARNVFWTSTGQIKLIDFGALAVFGTTRDVAGTPPYLAPEALRGQPFDQRADLYAVGALGYFLLTGRNAYAVRSIADLPEAWEYAPVPPSTRVRELGRAELPVPPAALDDLIAALMTEDPAGRPDSAAEVIDRLGSIVEFESAPLAVELDSRLRSKCFVGRVSLRKQMKQALARALQGRGGGLCVEGEQGIGRTRFLSEAALDARVLGLSVVETSAALHDSAYGVTLDLSLKLLYALPDVAFDAAQPFARVLGHLGPELRERLGISEPGLSLLPQTPGEARMRLMSALQDWFFAVARRRPLALFVDDVQALDEASTSFLASLARRARQHGLLVVSALREDEHIVRAPLTEALRRAGSTLTLAPLAQEHTQELLASLFGRVPNLARLSECLHRLGEGVPEHCMQLAEHLVREGAIRLVDGAWVLPQDLKTLSLPTTRAERVAAELRYLSPEARDYARWLSIAEGKLTLDACEVLSPHDASTRFALLAELVREDVLLGVEDGYRFRHREVQHSLRAELAPAAQRQAHRRLGQHLLKQCAGQSAVAQLQAGLHLLESASDASRLEPEGARAVARAGVRLALGEHASVAEAVSSLESSLRIFRAANVSRYALVSLLCPLSIAGFYADRSLGLRYGDETVRALEQLLGLTLAKRLRPVLGRRLSLYLGLFVGLVGFCMRRKGVRPGFREAIAMLFNTASSMAGAGTICIDPDAGERMARVLEPLTALGKDHAASVVHEFCSCLSGTVRDRLGTGYARWQALLARLNDGKPIRELPDDIRGLYQAGGLYACGVMECWRDDSRALDFADKLDAFGQKLYEMSGDQLRMLYYANQGKFSLSETYRGKVEVHAIQRGTAWQVETWTPGAMITVHLRTYDAMRLKQCVEQLKRLSEDIPSLEVYVRRAQGAYQLTRGKYELAAEQLEAVMDEAPLAIVGWARMHGALARAHNALGNHRRAREVCERALSQLTAEDLAFVSMNLIVQIEHAVARAGLGEPEAARAELLGLLEMHKEHEGALTLGALHEALVEVSLLCCDESAAAKHEAAMEAWYRRTKIASLVERCERAAYLRKQRVASDARESEPSLAQRELMTVVHRLRHGGDSSVGMLGAQWVLEQLTGFLDVREGYVYLMDGPRAQLVARTGDESKVAYLRRWVEARLRPAQADVSSVTAHLDDLPGEQLDLSRTSIDGRSYHMALLRTGAGADACVIGAFVAQEEPGQALVLPFDLLRAAASRLLEETNQA